MSKKNMLKQTYIPNLIVLKIACFIFPGLFFVPSAYADIPNSLKLYTVWNQFDATVNAFQRLALIMSDANYQGLFFGMFVIGLVAGGLIAVVKGIFQGKNPFYTWLSCLGVFVAGAMIYTTFIRSTTTITIYDEALNEMMVVPGIPDGVAFIAGFTNKIETGLIEMIWMAGDPRSYRENAGGLAYNIFTKAFKGGIDLTRCGQDGKYMNLSLARYTKDCFIREVGRPGTTLDVNDINDNTDFMPLYALAGNPALYTVWYDSTHKTGQTCTCRQAWVNLSGFLNTLTPTNACVNKFWAERCSRAGLGGYSSVGSGQNLRLICENKSTNFIGNYILGGAGVSSSLIMRQILIGHHLWDVITESPADEAVAQLGGRSAGLSMLGMGMLSNEWIPIIRSVSFCIFIGLIPFICLLIPTPLCGRAVSFILGIFVFLTSWGICDALVHSFAMDKTLDLFEEIRNFRLGLNSIIMFDSDAQKALAVFGAARWSAMMLAGSMSMMLVKFGGATFGHFAGRMTSAGAAGSAASGLGGLDPQATNSYIRSQVETGPMMTYANHGYKDSIGSGAYSAESNISTATGTMDAMGGNAVSAGSTMGGANVVKNRENVAHGDAVGRAENIDSGFVGKNAERSVSNQSGWIQGVEAQGGNVPLTSRIEGMSSGAGSDAVANFQSEHGIEAVGNVAYRNQLNNAAKQTAIKARNEIAGSGGISFGTMAAMQRIDQDSQGGHTMMNRHLQGMEFTPAPGGETNNVAGYFGIQPSDIAGKSVRMSGRLGENGGLEMSMLDAKSGRAIAEKDVKTNESGDISKHHDNTRQYDGGVNTNYSPAQSAAYSTFKGMLMGMGQTEANAEKYALKAVGSGWGSVNDGNTIGGFATNPASLASGTVLQGIDIANKVATDPDFSQIGNPLNSMSKRMIGSVNSKLSTASTNFRENIRSIPQDVKRGYTLGEAINNNDVETVSNMLNVNKDDAEKYIGDQKQMMEDFFKTGDPSFRNKNH